jgi:hypothetical protein
MQNPFRHEDPRGRPDHDDRMSQGGDGRAQHRPEEYRTWGGGDGGRTAEAFRHQGHDQGREQAGASGWGYGQNRQTQYSQGMSTPYTGDRGSSGPYGPGGYQSGSQAYGGGPQFGQDYGSQAHGSQGYSGPAHGAQGSAGMGARSFDQRDYGRSGGYGSQMNQGYSTPNTGGQYGGQAFGQGGMSQGYASHGYAPGSQIWEGSGPGMGGQTHEHHDFEPDYLHWRQQQLSVFDKDYGDWRNERREKFSSDFDSWRQSRPRSEASGEHHTPAENPIVGDVSDGGVGSAADAKKR